MAKMAGQTLDAQFEEVDRQIVAWVGQDMQARLAYAGIEEGRHVFVMPMPVGESRCISGYRVGIGNLSRDKDGVYYLSMSTTFTIPFDERDETFKKYIRLIAQTKQPCEIINLRWQRKKQNF